MALRWLAPVFVALALLAAGVLELAWGQEGLERLKPEERAIIERNRERWERMSPEERARVVENYRRWKSLPPDERAVGRENLRRFRALPPGERARIMEDLQRWNELPETRQRELQHGYERFQRLPQERRERIQQRFKEYEALPPEEKQRVMRNWERWRTMTPKNGGRCASACATSATTARRGRGERMSDNGRDERRRVAAHRGAEAPSGRGPAPPGKVRALARGRRAGRGLQLLLEALLHAPSDALRRSLHEVGRRTRLLFGCTGPSAMATTRSRAPSVLALDDLEPYVFTRDEVLAQLPAEERARFVYGETALTCDHCLGAPTVIWRDGYSEDRRTRSRREVRTWRPRVPT